MKIVLATSISIFLASLGSLHAETEGVANTQWCERSNQGPSRENDRIVKMPDGQIRGTRTTTDLYSRAVIAAKSGKDDEAVAWLADGCQHHSSHAADSIRRDRGSVLQYLKR